MSRGRRPDADVVRTSRFAARRGADTGRPAEHALRRLHALVEVQAARIAHVLHDEVSQVLAAVHIALDDAAQDAPLPAQVRLIDVRRHLHDVADQLRLASNALHPGIVEDLGLADAIVFTARVLSRRARIHISTSIEVDGPCPAPLGLLLYRFVHEALANIGRHAHATAASVVLAREGSSIVATVSDDGGGFDVAAVLAADGTQQLGLRLLRARLEAAGGTFDIVCISGQGTRLRATLPVEN